MPLTPCTDDDRQPHDPIMALWVLRALVLLDSQRHWQRECHFQRDSIGAAIQWPSHLQQANASEMKQQLRQMHARAERSLARWRRGGVLRHNLDHLAQMLGLNPVEQQLLEFTISLHSHAALDSATESLGSGSHRKMHSHLATLLAAPKADVARALASQGVLARSGLVKLDYCGSSLRERLEVLSSDFVEQMLQGPADPQQLLRGIVSLAPAPTLCLDDYAHIHTALDMALPYLRHCLHTQRRGVNLFLYGPPGTGKTQLTRVLAQALGCDAFDVACEDKDGDPISGNHRLQAYRATQSFFPPGRTLVVFDEVEDIFHEDDGRRHHASMRRKAWMNRALEDNPLPTLWLSNSIDQLDPAWTRRFDMFIELPIPPRAQRLHIARQQCGELLDADTLHSVADAATLAPAIIARAQHVVHTVQQARAQLPTCHPPLPAAEQQRRSSQAFTHLVNSTLQAQGHPPLPTASQQLPAVYDPAFISADADLSLVAQGLKVAGSARLCLYGPPGTGKTAYARWLAQQLDLPLLVQRGSDLQSKWVGGTEKNIAATFAQAQADRALLLIDEVDSFLQDRRHAQRHWEVSHVNEMLTQMESFDGIFIASTNLMDELDPAALRRFDLKVKFGYLQPAQAWQLLERCCAQLQLAPPQPQLQTRMAQLRQLTPGDFAAVLRQHRFRPLASDRAVIDALHLECSLKSPQRQGTPMGFL